MFSASRKNDASHNFFLSDVTKNTANLHRAFLYILQNAYMTMDMVSFILNIILIH